MPGSSKKGKWLISKWFESIPRKKCVLDIGPGWGTYSRLLKKEGEIWHAVEIHKPYVERFKLHALYEKIFIADVRKFIPNRKYDVIIFGDVLEHMVKEEVINVLKRLQMYTSYIIISLPLDAETHAPRGTGDIDWKNPYELHVSSWSNKELINLLCKLDLEIISMEKYYEIAVYLLASSETKGFLNETTPRLMDWIIFRSTRRYKNEIYE